MVAQKIRTQTKTYKCVLIIYATMLKSAVCNCLGGFIVKMQYYIQNYIVRGV